MHIDYIHNLYVQVERAVDLNEQAYTGGLISKIEHLYYWKCAELTYARAPFSQADQIWRTT